MRFSDRRDAGRQLAEQLGAFTFRDPIVLALPRGGVPVAFEVARALNAPLDVFVARKLGMPGHRELGIGAVAEGGARVIDHHTVHALGVSADELIAVTRDEQIELERRVAYYRGDRTLPPLQERDVILIDDGLATGVTAEAALRSLRAREPRQLILAVPVCPPQTQARLVPAADAVVCVHAPPSFHAVGLWYDDFTQTTDEEVRQLLAQAKPAVDVTQ